MFAAAVAGPPQLLGLELLVALQHPEAINSMQQQQSADFFHVHQLFNSRPCIFSTTEQLIRHIVLQVMVHKVYVF